MLYKDLTIEVIIVIQKNINFLNLHFMKNIFILTIFIINFSCMKDTFIVNPRSVKESKEFNAFIREFVGDTSVISIDNKNYLLNEVYLTYKVDSKNVYKRAISLVFKTVNKDSKVNDCPNDYTKFEILIDTSKYNLGENSRNLVSHIPDDTKKFTLVYYDKNIQRVINFKEKVEER
jgi:hypothetical protein